jgi:phosphoenolpyruvate carboxykinase (ATP)
VPSAIPRPRDTWAEEAAYDATAKKLAWSFIENFRNQSGAGAQGKAASPVA